MSASRHAHDGTAVAVRLWKEGMFTCHLSTEGYPHLRVSTDREVVVEEAVTTWLQACERALALQEVAQRTLAKLQHAAARQ